MDQIKSITELLRKRRTLNESKQKISESEKIKKFNDMYNEMQSLKDERQQRLINISKQIQNLISHKYSIYKDIKNLHTQDGLPISHSGHSKAIELFANAIDFTNDFNTIIQHVDDLSKIDSIRINDKIVSSAKSLETELNNAKLAIAQIDTFNEHIESLTNFFTTQEESMNLNGSIFET